MKKLLRLALAFVALLLLSLPAMAQMFGPALVTANVNLRNGAGTRHAVIRVLRINEEVMISHCASNWCLVDAGRDRGWVSQTYLRRLISQPGPSWPEFNFNIGIGRACFYELPRFRGASFCMRPGQSDGNLGNWRDRIGSVAINGRSINVDVCTERNFRNCTIISQDMPVLSPRLTNAIASIKVW